jgi:carotenoid cleavage dioxygenase-like enzyme
MPLARGTAAAHDFGRDATAGEAVFVPTAAGAAEDDGYVLAYVHNPDRNPSDLVIVSVHHQDGHRDLLEVLGEIGLGEGDNAVVV